MAPPAWPMTNARAGSVVILVVGVVLVFAGLSAALDFSIAGMVASSAAIAALLYAGGVWLGGAPQCGDPQMVLFTRQMKVASGRSAGRDVRELFSDGMTADIEEACRQALDGHARRFAAGGQTFVVSPIRSPEGSVVYGVLLSGEVADAAAANLTPV